MRFLFTFMCYNKIVQRFGVDYMQYLFGVDIGGTTVKIGLVSYEGELLDKFEIKTNVANNGESILTDIRDAIYSYLNSKAINKNDVLGIGFGIPGPVVNNVVYKCTNLGWDVLNIHDEFSKLLDWNPVIAATNDANAAALGELYYCKNPNITSSVMFTLGTGVGGGVVLNNTVLNGVNGGAGELGHIKIDTVHQFKCNCGGVGCLETVASATGVVNLANKYLQTQDSVLKNEEVTAKAVFDAAKAGDELALKVVKEVGDYIGKAAAFVSAVVDPDVFIIGGGVSRAGKILTDVIEEKYRHYAFHISRKTPFILASLGNDGGMLGAALLAKR